MRGQVRRIGVGASRHPGDRGDLPFELTGVHARERWASDARDRTRHVERVTDARAGRRRRDLVDVDDREEGGLYDELERPTGLESPDAAVVDGAVIRPHIDDAALDERSVGPSPCRVVAPVTPGRWVHVQREDRGGVDIRLEHGFDREAHRDLLLVPPDLEDTGAIPAADTDAPRAVVPPGARDMARGRRG